MTAVSRALRPELVEDGAVVRLVLDVPKANIIDSEMVSAIVHALDDIVGDQTKLIVFEGEGKNFSYGASVPEHERSLAPAMLESFHGMFRRLAKLAVPTCAVVRGQCLGGGLELASWCTYVVTTPDAKFGQPEIKLAVFPPMASVLLPWRTGGGAALDLCVSGRSVTAAEALALGIVNAVTEDPETWWRARFEEMRPMSATALRFAERAVRTDLLWRMDHLLPTVERLYLEELMATYDANEGIAAFMQRRSPAYRNR